jgi:hypothetical protein
MKSISPLGLSDSNSIFSFQTVVTVLLAIINFYNNLYKQK